jgi:hypothetical protein
MTIGRLERKTAPLLRIALTLITVGIGVIRADRMGIGYEREAWRYVPEKGYDAALADFSGRSGTPDMYVVVTTNRGILNFQSPADRRQEYAKLEFPQYSDIILAN